MLVPGMLRGLRPDLRIGFFLHIPFPPVELFMQLPRRADLLLGVDRLDYTKGIEQRLKAYRELLEEGAVSNDDVVLVQVATPSRLRVRQYQEPRERVEREVGRINGEFGEAGAAAELEGSFLVNPHDVEDLKRGICEALRADPDDRAARMRTMRTAVRSHTVEQ